MSPTSRIPMPAQSVNETLRGRHRRFALSLVLRNLGHFCRELSAIPNDAAPDPIRGGVLVFEKDRAAVQVEVADGNAEYNQRGA